MGSTFSQAIFGEIVLGFEVNPPNIIGRRMQRHTHNSRKVKSMKFCEAGARNYWAVFPGPSRINSRFVSLLKDHILGKAIRISELDLRAYPSVKYHFFPSSFMLGAEPTTFHRLCHWAVLPAQDCFDIQLHHDSIQLQNRWFSQVK